MTQQVTPTHCPYCALQCGMHVVSGAGTPSITSRDFPTNRGGLCQKGWSAAELLTNRDRLTTPLIRSTRSSMLEPASWDRALDRIAGEFARIQSQYGRDAVGVFGGGGLTNEKAYILGKFARVALRTANIDYNGRFCMASAAAAVNKAFGLDRGLPFPLEDIARAETIMLVGSNVAETMPPIMQYFDEQRRNGGKLIVVDPRLTPTARAAALHLQIAPGTDSALANGLLHIACAEGRIDNQFIATRTNGFSEVKRSAASYWPERVERITGVSVPKLRETARMLGRAATAMILTARGAEHQSHSVDNVLAFINLALALGKAGRPFCGFGTLTGQGNGQGGREHGQKCDQLPGYRRIDDPAARAHLASVWNIDADSIPHAGLSAYEMLDRIGAADSIRALLVMGSNIAVSAPRAGHIAEKLKELEFLVVSDFFLSETAQMADVVLPTAQWAEEGGTMTNLEGRVILRKQAVEHPVGARSDLEILSTLATRLGSHSAFPCEPREVFEELCRASAGGIADYSGITYEKIETESGVFWPCPGDNHPGTPRLFLDRFATSDGRARFHPVEYHAPAEEPDHEYPMYLTTGRITAHYQSGNQTRRVKTLNKTQREPFVEVHHAMAKTLGIAEGDLVRLVTRRGVAIMRARLSASIRMDTIFAPFHWAGAGCINLLTNPALDAVSKMPEFKVCAVRIEKIAARTGESLMTQVPIEEEREFS